MVREHLGGHPLVGTLPYAHLVWTDATWLIPRAYAEILSAWQKAEDRLRSARHTCTGCGATSDDPSWRTASTNGSTVLCPPCTGSTLRTYRQEFAHLTYRRVRSTPPAAEFRCAVCASARPALVWDHCHEHDLLRGPLSGSCNTSEGNGASFVEQEGAVHHLLNCTKCRSGGSMPAHHHRAVLLRQLHVDHGRPGCDAASFTCVDAAAAPGGGVEATIRCFATKSRTMRNVSAEQIARIVAAAVHEA